MTIGGSSTPIGPLGDGDVVTQVVAVPPSRLRSVELLLATYRSDVVRPLRVILEQGGQRIAAVETEPRAIADNAYAFFALPVGTAADPARPLTVRLELPRASGQPPIAWWSAPVSGAAGATWMRQDAPPQVLQGAASLRLTEDLPLSGLAARTAGLNRGNLAILAALLAALVAFGVGAWRRGPLWTEGLVGFAIVVSSLLLLRLSRNLTFFYDEWSFILEYSTRADIGVVLQPHSEHLVAIPGLLYKALLAVVGIRTYLPYMVVVVVLHAAAGLLLYILLRRHAGNIVALAAAVVLLFLGSAWEALLWAIAGMFFIGPSVMGLAALLLLDTREIALRRALAAALALVLSVATGGVGLFFVLAIAVQLMLVRAHRRWLWVPIAAAVPYIVWLWQHPGATGAHPGALVGERLLALPAYVTMGITSAMRGLAGLPAEYGPALVVAAVVGTIAFWMRWGALPARSVAALVALVAQFAVTGLFRSQFGDDQAASSRYIYTAAIFLLIFFSGMLTPAVVNRRVAVVIAALAAVAVLGNTFQLVRTAPAWQARATLQGLELGALEMLRGAPDLDRDAGPDPAVMPQVTVARYLTAVDSFGSPYRRLSFQDLSALPGPSRNAVDGMVFRVFSRSLVIREDDSAKALGDLAVVRMKDVDTRAGPPGCLLMVPIGPDPQIAFNAPSKSRYVFWTERESEIQVFLTFVGEEQDALSVRRFVRGDRSHVLELPDLGSQYAWRLRFDPAADSGQTTICSAGG